MLPDDEGIFDNKVLHIIHDIIRDGSLRQNNHYPCFYKVLSRSLRDNKHYLSVQGRNQKILLRVAKLLTHY
jgi:hypothetical protein